MTPAECLAIEPFDWHAATLEPYRAQPLQGATKQPRNAQRLAAAVEHGSSGRMHQSTPAVVFGFVIPVARLGQRQFQRTAVDGPCRIGAGPHHSKRLVAHTLSFIRPLVLTMAMIGQTWLMARFCCGLKDV